MILSMKKILKVSIHVTVGKSLEKNWCIWITWMQLLQSVVHRTMTCLPCSVTYMCIWGFVLFLKFWKCTGYSLNQIHHLGNNLLADLSMTLILNLNFVADFSFFWKDLIANREKFSELYNVIFRGMWWPNRSSWYILWIPILKNTKCKLHVSALQAL